MGSWKFLGNIATIILALSTLVGCSVSSPAEVPSPTPRRISVEIEKCCDTCYFEFTVYAWLDENENGTWDDSEVAMPGVEFKLQRALEKVESNEARNASASVYSWEGVDVPEITNEEGQATFLGSAIGQSLRCPHITALLGVYPTEQQGLRVTTEGQCAKFRDIRRCEEVDPTEPQGSGLTNERNCRDITTTRCDFGLAATSEAVE